MHKIRSAGMPKKDGQIGYEEAGWHLIAGTTTQIPRSMEPDGTTTGKCGQKRANGALGKGASD